MPGVTPKIAGNHALYLNVLQKRKQAANGTSSLVIFAVNMDQAMMRKYTMLACQGEA